MTAKSRGWIILSILAAVFLLMTGCASHGPDKLADEWKPVRLAVLPFSLATPDRPHSRVASPLTGATFTAGEIIDNATIILDNILERDLKQKSVIPILGHNQTGVIFDRLRRNDLSLSPHQTIVMAGKQLGVDGVLVGHVYRFTQRVGGSLSAEHPASAAFDLALIRVSDGALVWKNSFDEAQRALSEDLFSLRQYSRGIKWFTVEEFAEYGMDMLLDRFPWSRRTQPENAPATTNIQNGVR